MTEAVSRKRLLILGYFYPPLGGGGIHRVLGLTRHLPAFGWSCTVVCAGEDDYWVRDDTLAIPPGTEVIRVRGGSGLSAWLKWRGRGSQGRRSGGTFGLLRRASDWWMLPDSYRGWAGRARRVAARRLALGDVTALLSTSPPDSVHLAGRALARRFRVPWVADFRDPWIGLHFRTPPSAWHRDRQAAMEASVLKEADAVFAASRTHVEDLLAAFPAEAAKIHHLPNGYEGALVPAGEIVDREPDRFIVAFTGTLAQMPDALTFLDALHDVLASRPEARRRLRVRFAGPYETGVEDRAIALGMKGIVDFLGPLSHDAARALQRRADLLLLWKPRGEGYRTMVPGKLYEYLEAGRPMIVALASGDEAARLAREGGAMLVEPGKREPMREALLQSYDGWRSGGRVASRSTDWLEPHTRTQVARRAAELLEGLPRR